MASLLDFSTHWIEACVAYVRLYAKFFGWYVLNAASLIIFLGAVGIYSGYSGPDAVTKWVYDMLPWAVGLTGFLSGLVITARTVATIPRVSMELGDTFQSDRITTVYVRLDGLSRKQARVEVYCTRVTATKGNKILNLHKTSGEPFTLSLGEHELRPAFRYDRGGIMSAVDVLIPSKLAEETEVGDEFSITLEAYGEFNPVALQLRCAVRNQSLCIEKVQS